MPPAEGSGMEINMKKEKDCSRKKGKFIQLAILCAAILFTCTACGDRLTLKERVLAVFEEQKDMIREKIADSDAEDKVEWDDLEGVIYINPGYINPDVVIPFECVAEGILTSSVQAGFYYSPDDEPAIVGWAWNMGKLVEEGDGYSCSDGTDNYYYTERICENFYYYMEAN